MANKTVDQLQREYSQISEENRKAYDNLKGYGQGIYSWQNEYNKLIAKTNPTAEDRARIAELKPKFDEAQAKYKQTQEAKNAKKAELDAAQKAESSAKQTSAKKESAQANYDKALSSYQVAEAKLGGYEGGDSGKQTYINAYTKLKQAGDTLTQAGGTPQPLPEPKITIPTTSSGTGTSATGEKTGGTPDLTLRQQIDFLTKTENKDILAKWQQALAKNFGYKGKIDGSPDKDFASALASAYAQRSSQPTNWQGTSAQDFIFNPPFTFSSTGTSKGVGGTTIRNYTTIFNPTQAQAAINGVFQSELGRDATTDELKILSAQLMDAQKKNPTQYKVVIDKDGITIKDQTQTGGIDASQYLKNLMKSGVVTGGKTLLPTLRDEYAQAKTEDPKLKALAAEKRLYDTAMAKAGMDLGAKQKVKESTAYGRGLKELNTQVADYVVNAGGTNTPDEIAKFTEDLYNRGYDLGSEVGLSELQNFIKYGPGEGGTYTGKAGTVIADLAKTALANGLDLNKTFGNQIQGWLTDINKGEPIDNIKQKIREVAKIGMPDNVKKLIDNGVDLQSIYDPYRQTMASVLELSPDSITLSDPTLRAAITGQGEVPLYDFERALRKDNRWQYTNQARGEVSGAVQKVLQDFGFMG